MNFKTVTQNPALKWGALVALLAGFSQFDKGLGLVYSKWNADVVAGEAKTTAIQVKTNFDSYIEEQRTSLKLQEAYNKAQEEFNKKLVEIQEQQYQMQYYPPNQPLAPQAWIEYTADGVPFCFDGVNWWYPNNRGACE